MYAHIQKQHQIWQTNKQTSGKDRSKPLTLEALDNIGPFLQEFIISKSLPFDFLTMFFLYCKMVNLWKNKTKQKNSLLYKE